VSVQTKVLVPVLAFLVLLPAVMVWIVNDHNSRQVQDQASQTLSTARDVFLQLVENRSRDLLARFQNEARSSRYRSIAQLLAEGQTEVAKNTVRQFSSERLEELNDDTVALMFLADPRTKPVGARRGSAFELDELARACDGIYGPALQGESATGCVSLNGMTFDVVAVPVTLPDSGQPVGALVVGERIGESTVQELKKLSHTEIVLMADDRVTASTLEGVDAAEALHGFKAEGDADQGEIVLHGEHFRGLAGTYDHTGAQRGFRYVLLSSYEQSLRALEDTRWTLISVSIVGMILSGMAVWYFVRRSIQPLRELRDSAEAVGRGDFSRRIARFSNDECGELAEAFNHMTARLQSSHSELEKAVETLKTTQSQLVQSEKLSAVGQFVAGVAHELNNPLTAVIGFSDLLAVTAENSPIRPQLEIIAKSAHRCHKIVQSLLSFARQRPAERTLTSINATLEEVFEIMAYDLRTSNIQIVKRFQDDLPVILADPHQLQQVFVNILSNARQAIQAFRQDGRVEVRTQINGSLLRIELADNGPGIRPENLSRIFDPFFTTKPVGVGTGLGLSLCYGIIKEHGGHIEVTSQMGQGATFVIELPIAAQGPAFRNEKTRSFAGKPPGGLPTGKKVLIVDDEEWICALGEQLLQSQGHLVTTASSGERALDALRSQQFDVIVCDWKMPGMSGIHFYEHLLATASPMADRVYFMTGDVINETFQDFLKRRGKSCLPKPFSLDDFYGAVAGMFGPGGDAQRN